MEIDPTSEMLDDIETEGYLEGTPGVRLEMAEKSAMAEDQSSHLFAVCQILFTDNNRAHFEMSPVFSSPSLANAHCLDKSDTLTLQAMDRGSFLEQEWDYRNGLLRYEIGNQDVSHVVIVIAIKLFDDECSEIRNANLYTVLTVSWQTGTHRPSIWIPRWFLSAAEANGYAAIVAHSRVEEDKHMANRPLGMRYDQDGLSHWEFMGSDVRRNTGIDVLRVTLPRGCRPSFTGAVEVEGGAGKGEIGDQKTGRMEEQANTLSKEVEVDEANSGLGPSGEGEGDAGVPGTEYSELVDKLKSLGINPNGLLDEALWGSGDIDWAQMVEDMNEMIGCGEVPQDAEMTE